ncbi:MAG: hypothetical protein R3B94_15405 [Hyphomonas sp.]
MQKEVYALSTRRAAIDVQKFLDDFLPHRRELAGEYPVPQYSEKPNYVFSYVGDLLSFLESHQTDSYSVYWEATDSVSPIEQAMAFFTTDGYLIYGVVVDEALAAEYSRTLKVYLGAAVGVIDEEHVPPDTGAEFIQYVELIESDRSG